MMLEDICVSRFALYKGGMDINKLFYHARRISFKFFANFVFSFSFSCALSSSDLCAVVPLFSFPTRDRAVDTM